jgi:ABC-type lipoprotein release transport system permease subunit
MAGVIEPGSKWLDRAYCVMSHVVAGRTREIGLRMALGAQLSDVQKLIVRQGMWLAAIGSLIGLVLALTGARLLKSLLYGVSVSAPVTFPFIPSCRVPYLPPFLPNATAHSNARVRPKFDFAISL